MQNFIEYRRTNLAFEVLRIKINAQKAIDSLSKTETNASEINKLTKIATDASTLLESLAAYRYDTMYTV